MPRERTTGYSLKAEPAGGAIARRHLTKRPTTTREDFHDTDNGFRKERGGGGTGAGDRRADETHPRLAQEAILREFTSAYKIRPDQIWFDGDGDEPYFDFEALSLLVNELADIPNINVEIESLTT